MADDPQTWTGLSLEARHVPDAHDPNRPYPHDTDNPVTGFVDIGTVIDGVFVTLQRRKAPGLFADIARANGDGGGAGGAQASGAASASDENAALRARIAELEGSQAPPSGPQSGEAASAPAAPSQ